VAEGNYETDVGQAMTLRSEKEEEFPSRRELHESRFPERPKRKRDLKSSACGKERTP